MKGSVFLFLLLLQIPAGTWLASGAELGENDFNPKQVLKRALPAITNAVVKSVSDDLSGIVRGDELVLGVVVGGKARAYPINMLTGPHREIINDSLGGRPIAATW